MKQPLLFVFGIASLLVCLVVTPLGASPFSDEVLTFAQSKAKSDSYIVVERVAPAEDPAAPKLVELKVVQVLKISPRQIVRVGDRISLKGDSGSYLKPGELAVLSGQHSKQANDAKLRWSSPAKVTSATVPYITQAPSPTLPDIARAPFYIQHLEHSDAIAQEDAWLEFRQFPSHVKRSHAKLYDRNKLRNWITQDLFASARFTSYGEMLGYCGTAEDAKFLKSYIDGPLKADDARLGLDGLMIGYLWLTGEAGLKHLEDTKLKPKFLLDAAGNTIPDAKGQPTKYPFTEAYATLQAVRFLWNNGNGRISPERLKEAMYLLLDRPELADLAIFDLARWEDWSVHDRLMKIYRNSASNSAWVKTSIIRYMLHSAHWPPEKTTPEPEYVLKGREHLETLDKLDPDLVKKAKLFFLPD